jgi:cystathionine beta-synthase
MLIREIMMHESLLKAIGNTPLVRINFDSPAKIYAKLEYLNPGGSIKDRSALYMIEEAEEQGLIKPGGTLIEASSGNQGIATAMIGAIKGYKVIIIVSEKASIEKVQAIEAYGAKVIRCPVTKFMEDPQSYHSQALNLQKNIPNSFIINQYQNKSNVSAHYNWLGKEIWNQTQGQITHFFAGAGTCGTISGVGKYLKEQNPNIKIIAIDSINSYRSTKGNPKPYKLEGLGVDFDSPILDNSVIDEFIEVSDEHSLAFLKILARKHGFLVGLTSGAVAYAAQQYIKKMNPNDLVVIIFGDSGRAYLSKGFYNQPSDGNFIKINQKNLKNLEI